MATSTPDSVNSNNTYRLVSLATTNLLCPVANPVRLEGIYALNTTTTNKYIKLYNKASAPVVNTDIPLITVLVPGTVAATSSVPVYIPLPDKGIWFSLGLAHAVTGAVGDTDATAVGAGEIYFTLAYQDF